MATRTVKFYGNVYGSSDVTIRMNFNNVEVHNATIAPDAALLPAIPGSPDNPSTEHVLFTFDLDTSVTGEIPLEVEVNGGTVVFAFLEGNYSTDGNKGDDPATVNGALSNEFPTKANPAINGTALAIDDIDGEWWHVIYDGNTFTCDYKVGTAITDGKFYPAAE